jgi:hypothetical protein
MSNTTTAAINTINLGPPRAGKLVAGGMTT